MTKASYKRLTQGARQMSEKGKPVKEGEKVRHSSLLFVESLCALTVH